MCGCVALAKRAQESHRSATKNSRTAETNIFKDLRFPFFGRQVLETKIEFEFKFEFRFEFRFEGRLGRCGGELRGSIFEPKIGHCIGGK